MLVPSSMEKMRYYNEMFICLDSYIINLSVSSKRIGAPRNIAI